jgi:putative protein kinase ArgK-like GTPase of G3E family
MVGSLSSRGLAGGVGSAETDGIAVCDTTGLKVAASGLKEVGRCPGTHCFLSMLVLPPEVVDEVQGSRDGKKFNFVTHKVRCVLARQ